MVKSLSMKIYPNMDNVNKGNSFIQLGRYKMFSWVDGPHLKP